MEDLLEDSVKHESLIELLSVSIEKYESTSNDFSEFNEKLASLNSGVAALQVLMEQYELKTTDFENEIGGKSLVSMILNGKRALNLNHIRRLTARFNIPAQLLI
jgi:HTH-type transcriptional regulator/antitoxin HigA